ncbi:MAG: hypothetical protein KGP28_03060 [Bdellovibrionales bacterium]|nr:hypothetical protein [Bdellovibrionales bacterium]
MSEIQIKGDYFVNKGKVLFFAVLIFVKTAGSVFASVNQPKSLPAAPTFSNPNFMSYIQGAVPGKSVVCPGNDMNSVSGSVCATNFFMGPYKKVFMLHNRIVNNTSPCPSGTIYLMCPSADPSQNTAYCGGGSHDRCINTSTGTSSAVTCSGSRYSTTSGSGYIYWAKAPSSPGGALDKCLNIQKQSISLQ